MKVLTSLFIFLCLDVSAHSHLQKWQFINNIFYTNSPLPLEITKLEIDQAKALISKTAAHEKQIFTDLLTYDDMSPDYRLWALAIRDSDGDGIRDYVIDEYSGKFREGDLDIDGDGVYNVFDSSPYDSKIGGRDLNEDGTPDLDFTDKNLNQIPDHMDWSILKKSDLLSNFQLTFFKRFKIILVERSYEFNEVLIEAIYDILNTLYAPLFKSGEGNPSLRIIAMEENVYLEKQADLSGATLGMYMGFNPTEIFFSETMRLNKTFMLGVVAHELSHVHQYFLDYSKENIESYLKSKEYNIDNFHTFINNFGFDYKNEVPHFLDYFSLISSTYTEPALFSYFLDGVSFGDWRQYLNVNGINDHKLIDLHVVSPYSLSGPWEWVSEQTRAYLFNEMDKYAKENFSSSDYNRINNELVRASNLDLKTRTFYHNRVEGSPVLNYLKSHFPLSSGQISFLVNKYL